MFCPSKYNHYFSHDKKLFVYNFLSTSIIQLDEKMFDNLRGNNLSTFDNETLSVLSEEGFVVDCNESEVDKFQYYFERAKYSASADSLSLVFIPTYNCNLRCPYCYEGNNKSSKKMSISNIDAIIKFAKDRIDESVNATPIKVIDVQLYGGEPLLNKSLLFDFCAKTKDLAGKYGLDINYSIVTNLTLLDDEYIHFLKNYKIITQVSIDGPKTEHDKRRIYADGNGTYDRIVANLQRMVDAGLKDNIIIRLNVDTENLDESCKEFIKLRNYSNDIYFGVLTEYRGCNDEFDKCMNAANADIILAKKTSAMYKAVGLPVPQRFGKKGPCSLNCENKFMIDCNLDVYKCDLLINHKECRVGFIKDDGEFVKESNFYKQMGFTPFKSEKCIDCKYLPHCAGGCPAVEYLNQQKTDGETTIFACSFTDEKVDAALINYIDNI